MQPVASWEHACTNAAKAFVKTVVIVDDHPNWVETDELANVDLSNVHLDERPSTLPSSDNPSQGSSSPTEQSLAQQPAAEPPEQQLRVTDLVNAFADEGILCAPIISRIEGDFESSASRLRTRVLRAADAADILILDWAWRDEALTGDFVMSVLKELKASARADELPTRRRLVVIYTGEDDGKAIWSRLQKFGGKPDRPVMAITDMTSGIAVRVVQKPSAKVAFYEGSRCPEADLPDRVLHLFGASSGGLLANAVMQSLGHLRSETHAVLGTFDQRLDAAYVVHRAFNSPVEDAEDQLVRLVSDCINDTLEDAAVADELGESTVALWLASEAAGNSWENSTDLYHNNEALLMHLRTGVSPPADDHDGGDSMERSDEVAEAIAQDQHMRLLLADLTGVPGADRKASQPHYEFAALMYCSSTSGRRPRLQLGTVLEGKGGALMLCVQPLCDSARVAGAGAGFLFCRLTLEDSGPTRALVIRAGKRPTKVYARLATRQLVQLRFAPDADMEPIRAVKRKTKWWFTTVNQEGENEEYRHACRLRPMFAQDILSQLSRQLGRVGLMESEYFRVGGT